MKGFFLFLVILLSALVVWAQPNGPSGYSIGISERGVVENISAAQIQAQAGNITELVMNASVLTKNWQGYFGNISGKMTLDDASNWTLYNWEYANSQGYVFAARINTITWANLDCVDYSTNGSLFPNLTTEELNYMGTSATSSDGVDETFKYATHPQLTIGTVTITANKCNSTYLYVNDTSQTNDFVEVLLTDNSSNNSVIYTTIIEQNIEGFNNRSMDFEMIVGENGHGNSDATPYYFWVELV